MGNQRGHYWQACMTFLSFRLIIISKAQLVINTSSKYVGMIGKFIFHFVIPLIFFNINSKVYLKVNKQYRNTYYVEHSVEMFLISLFIKTNTLSVVH